MTTTTTKSPAAHKEVLILNTYEIYNVPVITNGLGGEDRGFTFELEPQALRIQQKLGAVVQSLGKVSCLSLEAVMKNAKYRK